MEENVIIFGADMSSSVHVDNKGEDILFLGKGPTQPLDDSALTTESKHPINSTQSEKRFVLGLHSKGSNSFLFLQSKKLRNERLFSAYKMFQKILQLII